MHALAQTSDGSRHTRAANDDDYFGGPRTRTKYAYDANGNRTTRAAGTFAAQNFSYLAGSNRMSATQYDGMGNKQESYATYNESGRLGFLSDAVTTDTMVLAYNGLGELTRTVMYHPDPCSIEQLLLSRDDYLFTPDGRALAIHTANTASVNTDCVWVDGLPVAQFVDSYDSESVLIGTTITYLHPDHLGTPRLGTSQAKAITWRYRSDAFGIPDAQTSGGVRLRFPGQISLGVAGVHYNYFRDYEAEEGRYLESDPIGLLGGMNSYAYVSNAPTKYVDALGLAYNVCLIPGAPIYIGIAPNSNNTIGRRTDGTSSVLDILRGDVPGRVNADPTTSRQCTSVPTTKEQDEFLEDLIRKSEQDPGPYNLRKRSCVDFVREILCETHSRWDSGCGLAKRIFPASCSTISFSGTRRQSEP